MKTSISFLIMVSMLVVCLSCENNDDMPPTLMDLTVYVFDSETGDSIRGVSLTLRALSNPGQTINPNSSGDSGQYIFQSLETGDYNLYVEKTGYIPNESPIEILPNKTNEVSIPITKIHS
jgi:hypothetical protein